MRIRWRRVAVNDLANIRDYIARHDGRAAVAVVARVIRSVDRLEQFPQSGRLDEVRATRELIVRGLPYIVVYTTSESFVDIVAVFHAAQRR